MKQLSTICTVLSLLCIVVLSGCSGGPASPQPTTVSLQSDSGDYIGQGHAYDYNQANAHITATATGGHLTVTVTGDQTWTGEFQLPSGFTKLETGTYSNVQRYPFGDPTVGGMDWYGDGRGVNALTGLFSFNNVVYENGTLVSFDLTFELHGDGFPPALHGQIHWDAADPTTPPGPVTPVPAELWQPPAGFIQPAGNYIYLQSDPGDYIGLGSSYTYTSATTQLTCSATGGHLSVIVNGTEMWFGDFQTMDAISQFAQGYYSGLRRYPFNNPAKGGLSWWGEGRACNTLTGWFIVDNVTYTNGVLTAIDMRFEQHSEGLAPALHGKIHWGP